MKCMHKTKFEVYKNFKGSCKKKSTQKDSRNKKYKMNIFKIFVCENSRGVKKRIKNLTCF